MDGAQEVKSLSLVVPVYNAPDLARVVVERLPELRKAAEASGFELAETIFVDDGSSPPLDIAPEPGVVILHNETNRGKGYSVRRGALAAKGGWVLMSDVDLSAPLSEFSKLAARADAWMTCGSRAGRVGMPLRRRFLSRVFHLAVRLAGVSGIRDTQCGFKLFRMDVMRPVFEAQRIERFAFDVELLRLVLRRGGTVAEVPVEWKGGSRSSLSILADAPRMLWDLIRLSLTIG